ncbi:hypothetical protein [Mycoplasma simbae]|uniref:hypothetical protein n=1 Tax=Mycoplasma simbae TaxID=36744 RepID=UPI0004954204|nr:hypothetical protein [Mycoplasma simbae]
MKYHYLKILPLLLIQPLMASCVTSNQDNKPCNTCGNSPFDRLMKKWSYNLTKKEIDKYWGSNMLGHYIVALHEKHKDKKFDQLLIKMLDSLFGDNKKELQDKKVVWGYLSYIDQYERFKNFYVFHNIDAQVETPNSSKVVETTHYKSNNALNLFKNNSQNTQNYANYFKILSVLNAYENTLGVETFYPNLVEIKYKLDPSLPIYYQETNTTTKKDPKQIPKKYTSDLLMIKKSWRNIQNYKLMRNNYLFDHFESLRFKDTAIIKNNDKYFISISINKKSLNNLKFDIDVFDHNDKNFIKLDITENITDLSNFIDFIKYFDYKNNTQSSKVYLDITDKVAAKGINNLSTVYINAVTPFNRWINFDLNFHFQSFLKYFDFYKNTLNINTPLLITREGLDFQWNSESEFNSIISYITDWDD